MCPQGHREVGAPLFLEMKGKYLKIPLNAKGRDYSSKTVHLILSETVTESQLKSQIRFRHCQEAKATDPLRLKIPCLTIKDPPQPTLLN